MPGMPYERMTSVVVSQCEDESCLFDEFEDDGRESSRPPAVQDVPGHEFEQSGISAGYPGHAGSWRAVGAATVVP